MCVCIVCPAPLWVGGACLYVHACIGVCMYLSVSMYVCMYSLCVCMYTCNACCEASTQTNLLLLSLLLGGPNPFGGGGGGHEPGTRDHIYIYVYALDLEFVWLSIFFYTASIGHLRPRQRSSTSCTSHRARDSCSRASSGSPVKIEA